MAYKYHRGIHKADAAALAKATELHEEHQLEEHARHEFHKSIIRNGIRKIASKMLPYVKQIVMLKISERTERIADKYGHYLAIAQLSLAITMTMAFIL